MLKLEKEADAYELALVFNKKGEKRKKTKLQLSEQASFAGSKRLQSEQQMTTV